MKQALTNLLSAASTPESEESGWCSTYTVLSGDSDSDGVAVGANAVSLNGGAIKDAAGNDAVLTHDAVAEDPDFVVAIGGL